MIEGEVESFPREKIGGYAQYGDGNIRIVRIKAWRGCGETHEHEGWIYETKCFYFL